MNTLGCVLWKIWMPFTDVDEEKHLLLLVRGALRSVQQTKPGTAMPKFTYHQIFVNFFLSWILLCSVTAKEEDFTEELLLRPLPDGNVLAHFHYVNSLPENHGSHHRLFPKAIYQLVKKFGIQELELSFTGGRWKYGKWGGFDPISSQNAKPIGVELWALFDVPLDHIDETWRNVTHALSGLFCASLNFLDSPAAYASPKWSFYPTLVVNRSDDDDIGYNNNSKRTKLPSSKLRYGALPREAVCTENLTPWLKLLPCRDKAGLALLMDRPSIYKGLYHSQRLYVRSGALEHEKTGDHSEGLLLQQTLTLVLQPDRLPKVLKVDGHVLQPSWSLGSLFGHELTGHCVLARSSSVFLELESNLVEKLVKTTSENGSSSYSYKSFQLNVLPDRVIKEMSSSKSDFEEVDGSILFKYSVDKYNKSYPLDVGMTWKIPIIWSPSLAPFSVSRHLMGSGNARGSIVIFLEQYKFRKQVGSFYTCDTSCSDSGCCIRLLVFQIVPWYVRLYYHTLQVYIDGKSKPVGDIVKNVQVSPAEDRKSPGMVEMEIEVPIDATLIALSVNFEKGFLRIDEHPPDANQGFDLPSASVIFPDLQATRSYAEDSSTSHLLLRFLHRSSVKLYTEVLLVPLATPDFSMPYNVITLTCTVLALYFGSLLNTLRRRIGEEERYLKSRGKHQGRLRQLLSAFIEKFKGKRTDSTTSKILGLKKIILVAIIAFALHYYLTSIWNV